MKKKYSTSIIVSLLILVMPIFIGCISKYNRIKMDYDIYYPLYYTTAVPLITLYFSLLHNQVENLKKEFWYKKKYMYNKLSDSKIFCASLTEINNAGIMDKDSQSINCSMFVNKVDDVNIKGFDNLDHTDVSLFRTLIEEFVLIFENELECDLKKSLDSFLLNEAEYYYIMNFRLDSIFNNVTLRNENYQENHFFVDTKVLTNIAQKVFLQGIKCKGVKEISKYSVNLQYDKISFFEILNGYKESLGIHNLFDNVFLATEDYMGIIRYIEKKDREDEFDELIKSRDIAIDNKHITYKEFQEFGRYHDYYKNNDIKFNNEFYVNYSDRGYFPVDTSVAIVYNKSMYELVNRIRSFSLS